MFPLVPFIAIGALVLLVMAARSGPRAWPVSVKRVIVGQYGASRSGGERLHAGVDVGGLPGDDAIAMDSGTVLYPVSGFGIGAGLQAIAIRHPDADYIYAEIRVDPSLKPGDSVRRGQRIGRIELNGDGTSMLHLEAWETGKAPRAFTPWIPGKRPPGLLDVQQRLPS